MSANEDAERRRIDAVAGVSRTAPEAKYTVEGLSFGAATLTRAVTGRWSTLTLSLTEEAATKSPAPTAREVSVEVSYWNAYEDVRSEYDAAFYEGLRALLTEHHLLSRPTLLTGADGGDPVEGAAAKALDKLREAVSRVRSRVVRCPVCPAAAPTHGRRGYSAYGRGYDAYADLRGVTDCPHAAMRAEALAALFSAHPELAFEAARVLVAAKGLDPPRFALNAATLTPLLGHWLMRRARSHYGSIESSYAYAYRRKGDGRRMSRVPRGESLSPALRAAVHYAAQSWEASGALEGFSPPTDEVTEGMPTMATAVEPLDVAVMWPEGVARPAPKETAERAAPPATTKTAAAKKAKPAKQTAKTDEGAVKAPTPGQMLMTAELRALGYSDAKVKSLLAAGTIERAGYGWFRWKG